MINQNTCTHENYPIKEETGNRLNPLDRLEVEGARGKTFDGEEFGFELIGTHDMKRDQVGYCSNCDKRLYSRPPEVDGERFQGWLKNGPEHPYKHSWSPDGTPRLLTLRDRYPDLPSPSWFLNNITRHESNPKALEWWAHYKKMHTDFQDQKHPNLGTQFNEITGRLDN